MPGLLHPRGARGVSFHLANHRPEMTTGLHRKRLLGSAAGSGERLRLSRRLFPSLSLIVIPERLCLAGASSGLPPYDLVLLQRLSAEHRQTIVGHAGDRNARFVAGNRGHDDVEGAASKEREWKQRRRKGRAFRQAGGEALKAPSHDL